MSTREQSLPVISPDLGLVSGYPEHDVPDRAWTRVENARFLFGKAQKVPGFIRVQAAALDSQIMGLFDFVRTDGFQAWIAVTRTKVYKKEPTDATFVDITGASPLTATVDDWADFTTFKDVLLITNGRDPIKKWTGAGNIANLGGSPPKARRIETFQNHVMLAWVDPVEATPFPQRIQWSELGLSESWAIGGSSDAGILELTDEPSGVLEIKGLRDTLVAYKEDAIHFVDYTVFPFTMSTRRMVTSAGPISARMVAATHDVHYFASNDRQIYKMTTSGPEPIGRAIESDFFGELNFSKKSRAFAFVNEQDQEIYFVIPTGGSEFPNMAYMFRHMDAQPKWGRRELAATASSPGGVRQLQDITWDSVASSWDAQTLTWDDTRSSAGANIILHGTEGGLVHKHTLGENDADGAIIVAQIYTKMFDLGSPTKKKRLQRLHLHYDVAATTLLRVYVQTADAPGSTPLITGPYEVVLDGVGDQWIDINLTSTFFGFVFRSDALNSPFAISGYVPTWYERETT